MKRVSTLSLAIILAITCCLGFASATYNGAPKASVTLSGYGTTAQSGKNSGEIDISFNVSANTPADQLGASAIKIYKSSGAYVTTITGSTNNSLIRNNGSTYRTTYTYSGTSGASYYAEVTIFAKIGSASDSRTVTTATVKAP